MTNCNGDEIDYEKQISEKDINRPERKERHSYTKYKKKCLDKIMLKCIKQALTKFLDWVY